MENITFNIQDLMELIESHEGRRHTAYKDSRGIITIGIGRNLESKGLNDEEIESLFFRDVLDAIEDTVSIYPNLRTYTENRQKALIDMAFNMGRGGLASFRKMRKAILNGDWIEAAAQAQDSRWYNQVGNRSKKIVEMLRNG